MTEILTTGMDYVKRSNADPFVHEDQGSPMDTAMSDWVPIEREDVTLADVVLRAVDCMPPFLFLVVAEERRRGRL